MTMLRLLPWLLVGFGAACAADPVPVSWELSERTQVVLLGTGNPNADPERSGPCTAVVVDGIPYLVDCGPGVVRRAAEARRNGVEGLKVSNLKHVFLTHLHTDHTLGLPDLIFTPWVLERAEPLKVFGPKGTRAMADHLVAAYDQDIRMRIDGLEPANTSGYKVIVREIKPGVVYQDERVTVKAIPVEHGSWKEAYGYRFETPDRVIVISGDCRPSPALVEAANGADILVHEVYSHARFLKRNPVWRRYHSSFHTSTLELGEIAQQARPKLLVLTHLLLWRATEEDLLKEIATVYDGPTVCGEDLDVY